MNSQTEDSLLTQCLAAIEKRLGWGSSETWTNQDFENLGEKIFASTGINLSVVTLKRIWGKIRYDSKPTLTTLNTLARFTGHENWRDFQQAHTTNADPAGVIGKDHTENFRWTRVGMPFFAKAGTIVILIAFVLYVLAGRNRGHTRIDPARFAFSSKKMLSEGLPNSVIFDYDASAAGDSDTVAIQQSWDKRLTQQVSSSGHHHTSIYYYPGFFRAKLVVAGQVIKEHDLSITTRGWLPLIEQAGMPVYLREADIKESGQLHLPLSKLTDNHINLQPEIPWVAFFQVRDFGPLMTDNFFFETRIRNDYHEGAGACQRSEVTILCENAAIVIPLSVKGCVSDLKMHMIDHPVSGKTEDLSGLGCDLSNWVKIGCRVKDKKVNIYVNDSLAYQAAFTAAATKIRGLRYRFQGTGSIASVKLAKLNGELVYQDDFK
jgi:hypothetical protein